MTRPHPALAASFNDLEIGPFSFLLQQQSMTAIYPNRSSSVQEKFKFIHLVTQLVRLHMSTEKSSLFAEIHRVSLSNSERISARFFRLLFFLCKCINIYPPVSPSRARWIRARWIRKLEVLHVLVALLRSIAKDDTTMI